MRVVPVAALMAVTDLLAWQRHGSIAAPDWLGFALLAALLLAVVLLSGVAARPRRAVLVAASALACLAAWAALSLTWSPVPGLARDEAALTAFYVVVFLVAVVSVRGSAERVAAVAVVVAGLAALTLAIAVRLVTAHKAAGVYYGGRLSFPIAYVNAQAAVLVIGVWPALVIAARRSIPWWARALSLAAATSFLAGFLMTQSKGSAVGLILSTAIVFALVPNRLRLLVPTLLAIAVVAVGAVPLSAPFRAAEGHELHPIHRAGAFLLVLTGAAAICGAAYAYLDYRVGVGPRARRFAAAGTVLALLAGLAAAAVVFVSRVDSPSSFASRQWRSFKHQDETRSGGTHFFALGSNRYDFWRVSLDEFQRHPIRGIGARGFVTAYLLHRRSGESPRRAHSLEADTLAELGVVGLILLGVGLVLPLAVAALESSVAAAAGLGAGVYWLSHASVDWIWTFPASGIPFFLLIGIAVAGGTRPVIRRRAAAAGAAAAALLAVLAFGPPWLSAKLTRAGNYTWARRLDPLSTEPLIAEAEATDPPSLRLLREAVDKEPRRADLHYKLGLAYLDRGDKRDAKAELRRAVALDPHDSFIRSVLRRTN